MFSAVIGQFAYCLRLTTLRFCMCYRLYHQRQISLTIWCLITISISLCVVA